MLTKEEQNKIWDDLSDDSKKLIQKNFNELNPIQNDDDIPIQKTYTDIFGIDNMWTPVIRTWEDIESESKYNVSSQWGKYGGADISASKPTKEIVDKCMAAIKITNVINMGYRGQITEKENIEPELKYTIVPIISNNKVEFIVEEKQYLIDKTVSFHSSVKHCKTMKITDWAFARQSVF